MNDDGQNGFELLSAMSAAELARLQRRVMFLEAALVQVLRDRARLREWFSASELAAMALPDLPRTRQGIAQQAQAHGWMMKVTMGRGGERRVYHFASLPRRAFEGMIDLVLRSACVEPIAAELPAIETRPRLPVAARKPTPAWVLPLLRMIRGERMTLRAAVKRLPEHMRDGSPCPGLDEVRTVMRELGMLAEAG